jgi:hypothetical protein
MKFEITGFCKVRDVIEADNQEAAEGLFRAKYPAFFDKQSKITDIRTLKVSRTGERIPLPKSKDKPQ